MGIHPKSNYLKSVSRASGQRQMGHSKQPDSPTAPETNLHLSTKNEQYMSIMSTSRRQQCDSGEVECQGNSPLCCPHAILIFLAENKIPI